MNVLTSRLISLIAFAVFYRCTIIPIPLAVIAVATLIHNDAERRLYVTIPLAVIAVATAGLENPCPERLSKPDLANQMNFCCSFQEN